MSYSQLGIIKTEVQQMRQSLEEYKKYLDPRRGKPCNEYERGFLDAVEFLVKRLSDNISQLEQGVTSLESELNKGATQDEGQHIITAS